MSTLSSFLPVGWQHLTTRQINKIKSTGKMTCCRVEEVHIWLFHVPRSFFLLVLWLTKWHVLILAKTVKVDNFLLKCICEWFIINTFWNIKMICVAWILQLCLQLGPVRKEHTCVSALVAVKLPTIQSVIELRRETTVGHRFQKYFFAAAFGSLCIPAPSLWTPAPPSP